MCNTEGGGEHSPLTCHSSAATYLKDMICTSLHNAHCSPLQLHTIQKPSLVHTSKYSESCIVTKALAVLPSFVMLTWAKAETVQSCYYRNHTWGSTLIPVLEVTVMNLLVQQTCSRTCGVHTQAHACTCLHANCQKHTPFVPTTLDLTCQRMLVT